MRLLAYHVVPGQFTSSQLATGQVKTVEGMPITVKFDKASNQVRVEQRQGDPGGYASQQWGRPRS